MEVSPWSKCLNNVLNRCLGKCRKMAAFITYEEHSVPKISAELTVIMPCNEHSVPNQTCVNKPCLEARASLYVDEDCFPGTGFKVSSINLKVVFKLSVCVKI